ncbi:helix-turn-helix domain-containing protein [Bradyrhizobium sp.]|uniref:helix-turn-helix domain-containing protein n=1 Tax=Bradyrhizobium sp. TaxID=376 RepID=UPI0039B9243E
MATKDLLDRLANLPDREANTPTVLPIEVVAFVVRWNRGFRQWKTTLAEFARVSVSTVERVERGERVGADALDRIAQAFGYDPGYSRLPGFRYRAKKRRRAWWTSSQTSRSCRSRGNEDASGRPRSRALPRLPDPSAGCAGGL